MAFIVQALQAENPDNEASIVIADREDALETAVRLSENGQIAVRIIGDGRIYDTSQFFLTVPITTQSSLLMRLRSG
jgi:hypothetical protein